MPTYLNILNIHLSVPSRGAKSSAPVVCPRSRWCAHCSLLCFYALPMDPARVCECKSHFHTQSLGTLKLGALVSGASKDACDERLTVLRARACHNCAHQIMPYLLGMTQCANEDLCGWKGAAMFTSCCIHYLLSTPCPREAFTSARSFRLSAWLHRIVCQYVRTVKGSASMLWMF